MEHFRFKDFTNSKDFAQSKISTSWGDSGIPETSANTYDEASKMREMMQDLTQAVLDFGPNKEQYIKVLTRHRTEWPYLWSKIDAITSFIASDESQASDE